MFLGIYFIWWLFILFYILRLIGIQTPVCDLSPIVFIPISAILGIIYSITFIIKAIISKEPNTTDYLFFLGIVTFPLVMGTIYLMSSLEV